MFVHARSFPALSKLPANRLTGLLFASRSDRELHLQLALIDLRALLDAATKEPRLKGPFPRREHHLLFTPFLRLDCPLSLKLTWNQLAGRRRAVQCDPRELADDARPVPFDALRRQQGRMGLGQSLVHLGALSEP